jgi:perosamine synthetase
MLESDYRIPVYEPDLRGHEIEYVLDCMSSGWISGKGRYVSQFEEAFAAFCGVSYGISTFNGTVALDLALATLGIGPGDEVITSDLTFVATANAIRHVGAMPVFVDSEPETWNIDPNRIEEAITPATKAIIVVHLYGHPADMDPILNIASRYGLFVIEDAAEAHGALYKGRRVGSLGHLACFSFYGNKLITTGEGGMVVTDNAGLAERARFLRGQAMHSTVPYYHLEVGYNFRMTNLQAAIGLAQLERVDELISRKRQIAHWYADRISRLPGLTFSPEADWATSVYWMNSVLVRPETGMTAKQVRDRMAKAGIETRPFFFPMHTLPPYIRATAIRRYPVAERLSKQGINLPSSPKLDEATVDYVINVLAEAVGVSFQEDDRHEIRFSPICGSSTEMIAAR